MSAPELSRPLRLDAVGGGRTVAVEADAGELAALAARFDLPALDRLTATWRLVPVAAGLRADGQVRAAGAQACVVTADPVPFTLDVAVALTFVEEHDAAEPDEEVELSDADLDTLPIEGGAVDLGEATAQSLALELDPYPHAPDADERAPALGIKTEAQASPFAALLGLGKPADR